MRGINAIIVTADPQGRFDEGIITDTSKPGTCMETVPSTPMSSGRFSYRHTSRNDGAKGEVIVLLPDKLQGASVDTAYTANRRGFLYWPKAGDELNMLMRRQTGTGTLGSENVGDPLEIDGASGMLQAVGSGGPTGTHASAPFMLLEHLGVSLTGDTLVHVRYTGNNA